MMVMSHHFVVSFLASARQFTCGCTSPLYIHDHVSYEHESGLIATVPCFEQRELYIGEFEKP